VREGALTLDFSAAESADRISKLMKKYADCPMDLADACLVVMTESYSNCMVVTLDARDFAVYRRHGREIVPHLAPSKK
jgi:predicted nucleic acid-binding protein